MSLRLDVFGVIGSATGAKLVAKLWLPGSTSIETNATHTGGTVAGTTTFTGGETEVYLGLVERGVSATFDGQSVISILPDSPQPYSLEVREVAGGTVMTSYSAIVAAFEAATTPAAVVYSRDIPPTLYGGLIAGGAWIGSVSSGGGGSVEFNETKVEIE